MPTTYKAYAIETLGYVPEPNRTNATYIAAMKAQQWLEQGKTNSQIFLYWNAGEGAKKCSTGTNKYGVKYDSCAYVKKGLSLISTAYAKE